jgi:hypothetical protein
MSFGWVERLIAARKRIEDEHDRQSQVPRFGSRDGTIGRAGGRRNRLAPRPPYEAGAQGGFSGWGHAIRPSGRLPAARALAVSGPASAHWNGRSRPPEAGSDLEADEVIVTGAHSTALVKTADGGEFQIFPEPQVRFRESRRTRLDPVDRRLNGIRTGMQRIERTQPCDSLSFPAAVLGVRAAILSSAVRGVAEFENGNWLGIRGRG